MVSEYLPYLTTGLVFLFVFIILYALLNKTKVLGENSFMNSFLALIAAVLFVIVPNMRKYTLAITPWIVILAVVLFFIFLVLGFAKGNLDEVMKSPALAITTVVLLIAIFVIAGIYVFGHYLTILTPLNNSGLSQTNVDIKNTIFHPAVFGAIIIFAVAAIVAYILNKK
jgi:hypothetical protein